MIVADLGAQLRFRLEESTRECSTFCFVFDVGTHGGRETIISNRSLLETKRPEERESLAATLVLN